jgi:hypothetical protein
VNSRSGNVPILESAYCPNLRKQFSAFIGQGIEDGFRFSEVYFLGARRVPHMG